jgi:hypothetical protein
MGTVISVYDTVTKAEGFLVEIPENTFIQNRYFPSGPTTEFMTKKVLMDFDGIDLKAGAWVKKGYKLDNTTPWRATEVEPPRNGVSDKIDPDDEDRILFQKVCAVMGDSGQDRVDALENLKRIKVMRLAERISRSIEKSCIQALIENAIRGTMETSPTDPTPIPVEVAYYDTTKGGNPQRCVPKYKWGTANATPYRDICSMCYALKNKGGRAREILISPQAWQILRNDPILEKYVSYYHSKGSALGDPMESDDAERVASVVFDGFALDVWVYSGHYAVEEDDGNGGTKTVEYQFLPNDFVCVLAEGCGRLFTAGVTRIRPAGMLEVDPRDTVSFIPRKGKFIASQIADFNAQELTVCVESKPLPAPKKEWQWITMLAGNTNDISESTVGPAISVTFETEEAGVTLPDDLDNVAGGSTISVTIPTVANTTVDVEVDGVKVLEDQTPGATVNIVLPMDDCVITFVYTSTL